jgi:hypothetical protein
MIRAKQTLHGKSNVGSVLKGEDGVTFIPEIDAEGNLSWSNDKLLPNPDPVNLKGPKGDPGPSTIPDMEQLSMLIDVDLLPAMFDETGAIITDGNGNVILKY